jgi:hypothetical protein
MKLILSSVILLVIFSDLRFAKGQDTLSTYKQNIFAGYWYSNDEEGSYNKFMIGYSYLNKKNEIVRFSLSYYDFITTEAGILSTISYDIPAFSIRKKFNIFLSGQFHAYYEWQADDKDHWRAGPFIGIGVIPSYTIAKRINISFEPVIGMGYLWANKEIIYYGHFNDSHEGCVDCGVSTFYSLTARLGYMF